MKRPCLVAAALCVAACAPNRTELGDHYPPESKSADEPWSRASLSGPPSLEDAAMAFDGDRAQMVLFGGRASDDGRVASDATWLWNGATWRRATTPTHPPGRSGHKMTFDQHRGRVVLVGGRRGDATVLVDTWEWDGASWTEVDGPERTWPASSLGEVWLYDDLARGSPVLITRDDEARARQWVLQARRWVLVDDEPGPADLIFSIAYDPLRKVAMAQVLDSTYGASTLESARSGWKRVITQNYPAPKMVFDAARRRMVMLVSERTAHLTLELGDGLWVDTGVSSPAVLTRSAMAYDSARGKVVLVEPMSENGTFFSETWER